jgi:hypothetical protein
MNKETNSGIGLGMVLFLIFMTLKLTENIAWSWWWVASPLWIPAVFVLGMIALVVLLKK